MTRSSQRGQALLEFAVSFFLIWLMFSGLYQFGYAFYVYNNLVAGVSSAAAMGARMDYDKSAPAAAKVQLTNLVLYGSTAVGPGPLVPGLTSANVNVIFTPADYPVSVTVEITNFDVDAVFKTFHFDRKPRVTTAYMGRITCSGAGC